MQRSNRVAHFARVERRALPQRHERAQRARLRPFEDDFADPHRLRPFGLCPRRQRLVADPREGGKREQGNEEEENPHSPSHRSLKSKPKSVPVVMCSLSSWNCPEKASES